MVVVGVSRVASVSGKLFQNWKLKKALGVVLAGLVFDFVQFPVSLINAFADKPFFATV